MNSITKATVWEYARRARYTVVTIWSASIILPIVMYGLLLYAAPFHAIADTYRATLLGWLELSGLLSCLSLYSLAAVSLQDALPGVRIGGGPGRLYTLPLATWRLALGQLLCGMATMVLLYLLTTIVVNLVFGAGWRFVGPALFIVMSYACLQAVVWNTLRLGLLQLAACLLTCVPLLLWIKSHFGPPTEDIQHGFAPVEPLEAAAMLVVTAAALAAAVMGIARDRRGDLQGWLAARRWLQTLRERAPGRRTGFRSAASAQIWCEWREKGWISLIAFVGMFVILQTIVAMTGDDLAELLIVSPVMALAGVIAASFAIALAMGHCNLPRGRMEVSTFQAALPVSDQSMAAAIMKTTMLATLVTWCLWLAVFAAVVLLMWIVNGERGLLRLSQDHFQPMRPKLMVHLSVAAMTWILPAVYVPIGLTGRKGLLLAAITTLPALLLSLNLLSQYRLIPGWLLVYAIAALMVGGTLAALAAAHRFNKLLLSLPMALMFWLLLCGGCAGAIYDAEEFFWPGLALMVGLAGLAVSPLATAPLAIYWNRHR
jgi:hypothetical protein